MINRGFTLIEVLIAMLILAVGVLGVASLQMSTYRQLQMSHNFATATMLAGEMADRMMSNPAEVLLGNYDHTSGGGTAPDCTTLDCTEPQMRDYDIAMWQNRVVPATPTPGALPSGSARIDQIGTSRNYVITVRWDDDLSGSTGTNCASVPPDANDPAITTADLDCYRLTVAF